jgi:hypothetical protein
MSGWIWQILLTGMGSVLVIAVIHALIRYVQDQYTTQKTKDLVHAHSEKYRKMLDEVLLRQQTMSEHSTNTNTNTSNNIFVESSLPLQLAPLPLFMENMENDLESYAASITTILPNTNNNNMLTPLIEV